MEHIHDIGVKNKSQHYGYQVILSFLFGISIFVAFIFWLVVFSDYNHKKFENGIEVQAEIIDRYEVEENDDEGYAQTKVYHVYQYISPDGIIYEGSTRHANVSIGSKIMIIIVPGKNLSTDEPMELILEQINNLQRDFSIACALSALVCVTTYLFFYRVVYRNAIDKKILKQFGHEFIGNNVKDGEVVKTIRWIVGYVKVSYRDDRDLEKSRWARAWFSRRETDFLEQKKYIKIVTYKNTYGILETMPIKTKQKKTNLQ